MNSLRSLRQTLRQILTRLLLAGLLFGFQPGLAAQSLNSAGLSRYDLRALPLGNLFYQLDCLAGQGYCSESSYRQLWQQLGWTAEDEARLTVWKTLKSRYSKQLQLSRTEPSALPRRFDGLRIWDKVRQAALNARSRQELALNFALVLRPADAESLLGLMDGFYPRFMNWWGKTGKSLSETGATRFAELLQDKNINLGQFIEQVSKFYGAELSPLSVLAFNFMARPDLGDRNLNGEQVENQSLIEIKANSKPDEHLDVVIHELSHYLFARMAPAREAQLIEAFGQLQQPQAIGAYNLLNEVMATCIGNALLNKMLMSPERFERYLTTPGSFYNDAWIDPLAKASYQRVGSALQSGQSLSDPAFIRDYLQLAQASLGPQLAQPTLLLRSMVAAYQDPDMAEQMSQLQRRLRVGVNYGANALDTHAQGAFKDFPALSGVLLVKHQQLPLLKEWTGIIGPATLQALQSQSAGGKSLIYAYQRSPQSYIFILVAPQAADFKALIEKLATTEKAFEGKLSP